MEKNLDYYMEHPDEMPEDPEVLAKLIEGVDEKSDDSIDSETVDDGEGKEEAKDEPEESAEAKKEGEPEKAEDDKPTGVLAKDGKNILPFEVLEGSRKRATALEEQLRATQDELQALKEGKSAEERALLSEEDLAAVEAETPALGKVLRALQKEVTTLREEAVERRQAVTTQSQDAVRQQMQQAIDANQDLARWQVAEPDTPEARRWQRAVDFDRELRQDPDWQDKPMQERFAEAERLTKLRFGDQLPQSADDPPKGEPKPTEKPVARKPEPKPQGLSLSDIPGGNPPSADTSSEIDALSLFSSMQKMSDAEIEKMLREVA